MMKTKKDVQALLNIPGSIIQQALGHVMKTKKDVVWASTDSSRPSLRGKVRLCVAGFAHDCPL